MAAPRGGSGLDTDTDTDSDSGGEAAAWFREAAWDCVAQAAVRAEPCGGGLKKGRCQPARPSLRREVNGHDEDGNELQTTPEFRAHVAKKLGAMLDSFITVLKDSSGASQTSVQQCDSADDGFRLFSSSVPGDTGKSEPCPAARRQLSSSSDTDSDQEWQKYQEAAVSATDILKQSAFPALAQDSSGDQSQGYVEQRQKKKKKKKIRGENNIQEERIGPVECDQISKDLPRLASANGWHERQDSNCTDTSGSPGVVKKKKKKKKRE